MATQNARVDTKPVTQTGDSAVDVAFRERTSLPARAYRQRFEKRRQSEAANDNPAEESEMQQNIQRMLRRRVLARGAQTTLTRKIALKGAGPALMWTAGGMSFLIAIISFLSIGLFANKDSWTSFFAGIFSDIDFEVAATVLAGINIVLAFATYMGFIAFFSLLKSNPLKTTTGLGATIFCMSLDFIPFIQIFPWLLIWMTVVAYTPIGKET